MRIYAPSNVWTNSEDVVLQAAIAKYGLHAWSKVGTMIRGKTPAECKARWYEYLSPSIKKSVWTPEEEQRLIELVRGLPNQWTTISAQLHRTADQCIQKYKFLSRIALGQGQPQEGDQNKTKSEGHGQQAENDTTNGTASNDVRTILQSLNYNSRAENRPSRADAEDLDEGEIEMLQTAQARIANTAGKKDKRRMREQSLQDAKDLAKLSRFRQLEAAGVQTKVPKPEDADLINDVSRIPGLNQGNIFDTVEERQREALEKQKVSFIGKKVTEVEGLSKNQQMYIGKQKQQDKQQHEKKDNLAAFIIKQTKLNDNIALHDRGKLIMSEDQLVTKVHRNQVGQQGESAHLQNMSEQITQLRQVDDGRKLFDKNQLDVNIKNEHGNIAQKRTFSSLKTVSDELVPTMGSNDSENDPIGQRTKKLCLPSDSMLLSDLSAISSSSSLSSSSRTKPSFSLSSQLNLLPEAKQTHAPSFVFNFPQQSTTPSPLSIFSSESAQKNAQLNTTQLRQNLANLQIDSHLKDKILAYYNTISTSISTTPTLNSFIPGSSAISATNIAMLGKPIIPPPSHISSIRSHISPPFFSPSTSQSSQPNYIDDLSTTSQLAIQELIAQELIHSINTIINPSSALSSSSLSPEQLQFTQKLIKQELNTMNKICSLESVKIQSPLTASPTSFNSNSMTAFSFTSSSPSSSQTSIPDILFNPITTQFISLQTHQIQQFAQNNTQNETYDGFNNQKFTTNELQTILRQEALRLHLWLQQSVFDAGQTSDINITKGDKKGSALVKLEKRAKIEFKGYLSKNDHNATELSKCHGKYIDLLHQYEYMTQLLYNEEKVIEQRATKLTDFYTKLAAEQYQLQQIYLKRSRE